MQINTGTLLKNALIEYVKSHNECSGTIMEFADNLEEAIKTFYKLPINVQDKIGQILLVVLSQNGIIPMQYCPFN